MARIDLFNEYGTSGVPQFAGRLEERYLASLRGPTGIQKMAEILRKEPAAYTAHSLVLLTAAQATWRAVPPTDRPEDREAAEFLEQCLQDMSQSFSRAVRFALSALAFGFADLEIVWKRRQGRNPGRGKPESAFDDGLIGIRKLAPRRQETIERWEFDDAGGPEVMIQRHPTTYQEIRIPIEKLLHFIGGDDRGSWEGLGWLEPAYKLYHMIENYEIMEGIGWQRSFVGLPVFEYVSSPDDATKNDVQELGKGLVANEKQYVTYPGPVVNFRLETVTNSNAGELRQRINQLRWEIMTLVFATFVRLGSTTSGSRALSQPLIDLFRDGVNAALDDIADVFNRHLVPRLFKLNAGEFVGITAYPVIEHSSVSRLPLEVVSWIDGIQQFLETAEPTDAMWLRDMLGMPSIEIEQDESEDEGEESGTTEVDQETGDEEMARGDGGIVDLEDMTPQEQAAILMAAARMVARGG